MCQRTIIADDLTGAMDTGVQLVRSGRSVCLLMPEAQAKQLPPGFDFLVLDTESRNLTARTAAKRVTHCITVAGQAGYALFYHKIDSTLRGNPGAEIAASLRACGLPVAVVVAAMPTNGRVTRGGRHFVDNRLLTETEYARDPYKPIRTSDIRALLAEQTDLPVTLVCLQQVRQGYKAVAACFQEQTRQGKRLIVCDAETETDLQILAEAVSLLTGQILPCGAAEWLSQLWGTTPSAEITGKPLRAAAVTAPVVVFSASPASAAKEQIAAVRSRADTTVIVYQPLASGSDDQVWQQSLDQVCLQARSALQAGRHVVIDVAGESKSAVFAAAGGNSRRMAQDSRRVQDTLTGLVRGVLQTGESLCGGLVCFGGDTARSVLRQLQATVIEIEREVERFIPSGRVLDGPFTGLPIVTKAGGFGHDQTLQRILDDLTTTDQAKEQAIWV